MQKIPKRRLILGVIVIAFFLLFTIWVSPWWLLALPLLVDYYFTRFIPWNIARKVKNKALRTTLLWTGDIIFCLVGVYLISIFFFQNFVIPSSSLEKTMLVGDYVLVSKLSYGPRTPNTPLAFPLAHNTMPLIGGKSYSEKPHWEYKRIKGFGQVKRNDLVVFNFPAGDTVCLKRTNPDYYSLVELYGRQTLWDNPQEFGDIVARPVDRRDHYVKRCVGLPGDSLSIRKNLIYVNGVAESKPKNMQLSYWVQAESPLNEGYLMGLGISRDDLKMLSADRDGALQAIEIGFDTIASAGLGYIYLLPLTQEMHASLSKNSAVKEIIVEQDLSRIMIYPQGKDLGWTRDDFGPVWIPKKGASIQLTPDNLALYSRCIRNYEGHTLTTNEQGQTLIDGKPATSYTFAMDYYFMMGDNRHMSADSRYWGFVPEDHIVGKPSFIWLSLDKDKGLFSGKVRWNRMMRSLKNK